jgi:hypothetical protein
MDASTSVDPVKRAKAAAEARIALVGAAAKRQEKIAAMVAKLQEEHGHYGEAYRAALAAWSKEDLEGFGLTAPEQLTVTGTGSARRSAKRS